MEAKLKYTAPYELKKAHEDDSCYDIRAWVDDGKRRKHDITVSFLRPGDTAMIPTGLRVDIPEGYEVQIRPRSGLTERGIIGHFGTIDRGYTGELCVILTNLSKNSFKVKNGDRVGQIFIGKVEDIELEKIDKIEKITDRGENGFGSSGI